MSLNYRIQGLKVKRVLYHKALLLVVLSLAPPLQLNLWNDYKYRTILLRTSWIWLTKNWRYTYYKYWRHFWNVDERYHKCIFSTVASHFLHVRLKPLAIFTKFILVIFWFGPFKNALKRNEMVLSDFSALVDDIFVW